MEIQLKALDLLKDWSTWLVAIQTGALGLISLSGQDKTSIKPGWAYAVLICFAVSIITATFVLGGIPSIVQRLPQSEEKNIYHIPIFERWPRLWYFTFVEHVSFLLGVVLFVIAFTTRNVR